MWTNVGHLTSDAFFFKSQQQNAPPALRNNICFVAVAVSCFRCAWQVVHVRMGSKPSTTKSVAKQTDKNSEISHKNDAVEQKQQTETKVATDSNPSKIDETTAEETETVPLPTRRVTMTSQISFADKDDNGRKHINQ